MYAILALIFLFHYSPTNSLPQKLDLATALKSKPCQVIEENSSLLKSCKFPFIYKDNAYYGCTTVDGVNGKAWCSTKIDPLTNEHVEGGYRGDCPNSEDPEYTCKSHEEGLKKSEDFNQYKNSLEELGVRSDTDVRDACECVEWDKCNWANDMVLEISDIPRGDPLWMKRVKFFKDRICDRKTKSLYCCDEEKPPNDRLVKLLRDPSLFKQEEELQSSGKWKPNGYKEECGTRTTLTNIVGGKKAKRGDFPYMALLGYATFTNSEGKSIKSYDCGGSLINKWYVLTAAHCMFQVSGNFSKNHPTEVVLGELRIDTDPDCTNNGRSCAPRKITREIKTDDQIIVHENYQPGSQTQVNDIALIRLNEPVPLYDDDPKSSNVRPVCLPWQENDPGRDLKENKKAVVTGWGRVKTSLKDLERKQKFGASARNLLYVRLPIANQVCEDDPDLEQYWDPETKICAGGKQGQDACQGDSGGPMVIRDTSDDPWYQIGLVSFGLENICGGAKNREKKPGVFTKVVNYLPWIESKLKD